MDMVPKWMAGSRVYAPSWMIIGICLVLMAVVVLMGVTNYNLEKNHMKSTLKEKGAILIRSFEAGTQTGMMGLFGNEAHLQTLLKETVARSDVSYIALVGRNGTILAHNRKELIGTSDPAYLFSDSFSPDDDPLWRTVAGKDGETFFEVYKTFLPLPQNHGGEHEGGMQGDSCSSCSSGWMRDMPRNRILDSEQRPAIVIGMDIRPFEEAKNRDIRNSLLAAALIFLLALTGVVSLFWVQNFMNSRKMLQDIRALAAEIVRNLPVGMVVVGGDGRIRYINGVACSLLTVQATAAEGSSAEDVLPETLIDLRRGVGREKPVAERELRLSSGEKPDVPVNVSTANIVGEDGQYLGFMFILQDLSELRQLETKIRQREKLAAIGDLAAGIAHEVRNPLSSIKGYVTFLGSLFEQNSENRKVAEMTGEEVDRVNRVISELLEFARPSDLKPVKTDICGLIDHSLGIVAQEAAFTGITIHRQLDRTLPELLIDPDRITQVLLNLMINAIQAMDRGGQLLARADRRGETVVVEISDTGRGISPEDEANIFNPYFTTKKNGTGLGLAIVHKIVENHGGYVRTESRAGVGTRVSITLPLRKAQEYEEA